MRMLGIGLGLLLAAMLFKLGLWQLDRADEKQQTLDRSSGEIIDVRLDEDKLIVDSDGRGVRIPGRIRIRGSFDVQRYWLLDNQMFSGQFGYRIFQPFCQAQRCLIVDRGWVPGFVDRDRLPTVSTPENELVLQGVLAYPQPNTFTNDEAGDPLGVVRVQTVNVSQMARSSGLALSAEVLHLLPESEGVEQVLWQPANLAPSRHHGYAVQWFLLSLTLAALTVWFGIFRVGGDKDGSV